jgi:lipoyl(octanoyl) transferase
MPEPAHFRWLGMMAYGAAWRLQEQTRERLIQAKRADPPTHEAHVVFGVEHPPVYTFGKSADRANLLASSSMLEQIGAESVAINRGGDITFHGPGQLVVYPILDLERIFTDLSRYLRSLEQAVIDTLADFGISAGRVAGRTGVWVGSGERGDERKICAMGIHCRRWVTSHGLALNVNTDLDYFSHIIPCGITDRGVTSMRLESGTEHALEEVFARLVVGLAEALDLDIHEAPPTSSAQPADGII